MAVVSASTSFKKRDGKLTLAKDTTYVAWAPTGAQPEITITIPSIINLQQTPPDKAKVMLKIITQPQNSVDQVPYLFTFTSATNARAEADTLRDALSQAIAAAKTQAANTVNIASNGSSTPVGGSSASIAITAAQSTKSAPNEQWFDDDKLRADIALQQSLLRANPQLSKTLMEALNQKPESISTSQFTTQFWSSRLNLLRAHAIEKSQSKGSYNVFASIETKDEEGAKKMSITPEQIQLIFRQHPLVKHVYDGNVPKISETDFWTRFFKSRLFKKLKGEKVTEADYKDNVIDKYLDMDDDLERAKRLMGSHIPHIIDLAGNEFNHSQKFGNRPDLPDRPEHLRNKPIIHVLNSVSEKILANVTPNDVDPSAPIGVDEETYNQLALRDLQGDAAENHIVLNIKDQSRFFSSDKTTDTHGISGFKYSIPDLTSATKALSPDLAQLSTGLDLNTSIGIDPDSSDSDTSPSPTKSSKHVGSRLATRQASAQVTSAIRAQRSTQAHTNSSPHNTTHIPTLPAGLRTTATTNFLSQPIFDKTTLTHATTSEFLKQFYAAFLSGQSSRADEIARLAETLDRAVDRVAAVAKEAEDERREEVRRQKKQVKDVYERTRRTLPFEAASVPGGERAVKELMGPTLDGVRRAVGRYREALREAGAGE